MNDECQHRRVSVLDSMPPMRSCVDCGESLPLTEQDKRDYRDYSGHDWIDPPTANERYQ
jgi:hypothetical protein